MPFAEELRASLTDENRIPISAVGLITNGKQAEEVLQKGKADIVCAFRVSSRALRRPFLPRPQITVAREFLRNADLVFDWAQELDTVVSVPVQYERAHTRMFKHASMIY